MNLCTVLNEVLLELRCVDHGTNCPTVRMFDGLYIKLIVLKKDSGIHATGNELNSYNLVILAMYSKVFGIG